MGGLMGGLMGGGGGTMGWRRWPMGGGGGSMSGGGGRQQSGGKPRNLSPTRSDMSGPDGIDDLINKMNLQPDKIPDLDATITNEW